MEDSRYFSIQLIDLYTHIVDYVGTRTTGNDGGNFLLTGPEWQGDVPSGIDKVIPFETQFLIAIYSMQLFNPDDLMARFAKNGVGAGREFDATALDRELRQALEAGIAEAWEDFNDLRSRADRGEVTSGDVFGSRDQLRNNYLYRFGGAALGIWGHAEEEAMYPTYYVDGEGQPLTCLLTGYRNRTVPSVSTCGCTGRRKQRYVHRAPATWQPKNRPHAGLFLSITLSLDIGLTARSSVWTDISCSRG